jgi:hypothetical protein
MHYISFFNNALDRMMRIMENKAKQAGIIKIAWLAIALSCPAFLIAQASVSTQLAPSAILIGDQSLLSIIVTYPADNSIDKVDFSVLDELNNLEVLNAEQLEKKAASNNIQTIIELKITCWEEGTYEIPPIPIRYQDANGQTQMAQSTAQVLNVGTIPVEQDSLQLMPIREIIDEPLNFRDILPYLIGILVLAILGMVIYFSKRKKKTAPPPPPISVSVHELALQRIHELARQQLWQKGEIKLYHSELTRILRAYLEHRYSINALELTTDEIVQSLQQQGMEEDLRAQLTSLLRTVDLVKFAKAEPPASFHSQAKENVDAFIRETKNETLRLILAAGTPLPPGVQAEKVIIDNEKEIKLNQTINKDVLDEDLRT